MPDWKQMVRDRLNSRGRDSDDSVVAELAAHLEEVYETACTRGALAVVALEQALEEGKDWRALRRNIQRATSKEDRMNYRTKSLWLPALITLLGASVSLVFFQYVGVRPHLLWFGRAALTLDWAWLASLPIFGALGAHLSGRAQARTGARLIAGLAPAIVMLVAMGVVLPWGLALDGIHFIRLVGFGLGLINGVVVPALALLVGALPFVSKAPPKEITTAS